MDASPGEASDVAEDRAVALYDAIQQAGWELVTTLRTFRLSEQEAEALYVRLTYLATVLPGLRQAG